MKVLTAEIAFTSLCLYCCRSTPRQGVLPRKRYSNFQCSGSETSLLDCGFIGPFPYRCFTTSYAGVQCQESGGWIPSFISLFLQKTKSYTKYHCLVLKSPHILSLWAC